MEDTCEDSDDPPHTKPQNPAIYFATAVVKSERNVSRSIRIGWDGDKLRNARDVREPWYHVVQLGSPWGDSHEASRRFPPPLFGRVATSWLTDGSSLDQRRTNGFRSHARSGGE